MYPKCFIPCRIRKSAFSGSLVYIVVEKDGSEYYGEADKMYFKDKWFMQPMELDGDEESGYIEARVIANYQNETYVNVPSGDTIAVNPHAIQHNG